MAGTFLGQLASSLLVSKGNFIWLPWVVGVMMGFANFGTAFWLLPELGSRDTGIKATSNQNGEEHVSKTFAEVRHFWEETKSYRGGAIGLLLMSFLGDLGFNSLNTDLLLPFISAKFHQDFPDAGLLSLGGPLIQAVLFLLILPFATFRLICFGISARATVCGLALVSSLSLAIGALALGLSPKIIWAISGHGLMSVGTGFMILVSSLVVSSFSRKGVTVMYAITNVLGVIASAISGPTYSILFSVGMSRGALWVGLPYMVAACLLIFAFGITGMVTAFEPLETDMDTPDLLVDTALLRDG